MSNILYNKSLLFFVPYVVPTDADKETGRVLMKALDANVKFRNARADDGGNPETCDFVYADELDTLPERYRNERVVVDRDGKVISEPNTATEKEDAGGTSSDASATEALAAEVGQAPGLATPQPAPAQNGGGGWGAPS